MKKGITKYWIEIIGGVIVVVIILLIIIYFGSTISTAVEDANNKQTFNDLKATMAKAMYQGEETLTPFRLATSSDDRYYAIVYLMPDVAQSIYDGSHDGHLVYPLTDETSKFVLQKCTQTQIQPTSNPNDWCMCLMRIDYENTFWSASCDDNMWNVITVTPSVLNSYASEETAISDWNTDSLLETLDNSPHNKFAVKNLKILDCSLIMSEIGCTYTKSDNSQWPCMIHYNNKPIVWLGGSGGKIFNSPLDVEIVIANKTNLGDYYMDLYFLETYETFWNSLGKLYVDTMPCDSDCGRCD